MTTETATPKNPKQAGITVCLYSIADPTVLEKRLFEHDMDVNIKPLTPPPGLLHVPGKDDIVVVDYKYCGSAERTALLCVAPIREAGFKGPIIVNECAPLYSSLLQVAGATHTVQIDHEEGADIGLLLAKTVRAVILDVARYKKVVQEQRDRRQGAPALEKA